MTKNKLIDGATVRDPANDSNSNNINDMNDNVEVEPSLVPRGFTIGLALFSIVLSLSGYVFRFIAGDSLSDILRHAAILVPLFVIGIPLGFWIGALIMNKIKGMHIQRRNAFTLGWLISCVTMLWLMGTYS